MNKHCRVLEGNSRTLSSYSRKKNLYLLICTLILIFIVFESLLPVHKLIESHCNQNNIPVRDFFSEFFGHNHSQLWVHASDPHPNEKGHKVIAKALSEFIHVNDLFVNE